MKRMDQCYQILGLTPGASKEEIVHAYKLLVATWYTHRNDKDHILQEIGNQKLAEIEEAYVTLMTPRSVAVEQETHSSETTLEIKSEPSGARVFVDGREAGECPLVLYDIHAGEHAVRVVKDGYEPSEGRVELQIGDRKLLNAPLKKAEIKGSLPLQAEPVGAKVHVDCQPARLKPIEPERGAVWKDPYLGIEFVYVRGGSFQMGDAYGDGEANERPVHEVHLNSFWIGRYPVTQKQWTKLMGPDRFNNPSYRNHPANFVSWYDVEKFILKLNQLNGENFRLPTEAEWEYAAGSGDKREKWAGTNSGKEVPGYAWYWYDANQEIHPVCQKKPNGLGLCDMSGNVREWVNDWYELYHNAPQKNPVGEKTGTGRVIKGGCMRSASSDIRITRRSHLTPEKKDEGIGFRLVFSVLLGESVLPRGNGGTVNSSLSSPHVIPCDIPLEPKQEGSASIDNKGLQDSEPFPEPCLQPFSISSLQPSPPLGGQGSLARSAQGLSSPAQESNAKLKGVGGWLTLFCVGLTILGPLFWIVRMVVYWDKVQPAFTLIPSFEDAVITRYSIVTLILVYGFITGCRIWSGSPNGRSLARDYLWTRMFVTMFGEFVFLVWMLIIIPNAFGQILVEAIVSFIQEIFLFLIWYSYFKKSKRVRATYGGESTQ